MVGHESEMNNTSNSLALATEQITAPLPTTVEYAETLPIFINRDLSLLEFFDRVLEEGLDASQPLFERLNFLSILSSNLDEFFMIRVSGLKEKLGHDIGVSADGYSTGELLAQIRVEVMRLIDVQMRCIREEIFPELAREGITIKTYESLTEDERRGANDYFKSCIYPLLTPQAVDPSHPFPYISGGSINIGLTVKPKLSRRVARAMESFTNEFFVRLKLPTDLARLIPVGKDTDSFVLIEDLTRANIRLLIPEATPESCHLFRITRDADVALREAETEDLLQTMEENLKLRRFGNVVRLEISDSMPPELTDYLATSLEIADDDIYSINGPLDVAGLSQIRDINRPDLKTAPLKSFTPPFLTNTESKFDLIKSQDVLLHHPYMPYSVVTDFIREAAHDPDVMAIKMCLYRIGAESPIAPLLIEASELGKQVTVVIEIKARFDEANNIEWGKRLEQAGVHVVYGLLGLKTHAKATLIIRREDNDLVRYVHLATGNYNPETSAFYTDLGLLTARKEIGEDATELFNYLTVYSQREKFQDLVVAPIYLREKMLELIGRETTHAEQGRPARIIAKMNRLADPQIVNSLYEASQAGVQIDLIVRGVCTLRPGVKGLSENIRVRSIVGRLLEHSRVYYFENAGNPDVYTGSSDWMPRNLDRRVEVLVRVHDPSIRRYLTDEFLSAYLKDNVKARELLSDGHHRRVTREPGDEDFDSQLSFQNPKNVVHFGTVS